MSKNKEQEIRKELDTYFKDKPETVHNQKLKDICSDILLHDYQSDAENGEHNSEPFLLVRIENLFAEYVESDEEGYERDEDDGYDRDEGKNNSNIIELSVLSQKIVEYDKETMFIDKPGEKDEKGKDWGYKPFFINFLLKADERIIRYLQEYTYRWYKAYFIAKADNDSDNEAIYENNTFTGNAIFLFASSPIFRMKGQLIIINESLNVSFNGTPINDLDGKNYDPSKFQATSDSIISAELNTLWDQDDLKTIDIYNLVHGNADYIRGNNNRILFDIGYPYKSYPLLKPEFPKRAIYAIRNLIPSAIIVSHWDTDHYMGCVYANSGIFDAQWVAPSLNSILSKKKGVVRISTNVYRLAAYLKTRNKLMLVEINNNPRTIATIQCKNSHKMILGIGGKGKRDSKITAHNRHGLYFNIIDDNSNINIVLSADVPYSCMDSQTFCSRLNYLHVPHHCSDMNLDVLKNLVLVDGASAIISNEKNTVFGEHIKKLCHLFRPKNIYYTPDPNPNDKNGTLSIEISINSNGNTITRR